MDYDILILGGGILGCSIAYELSKYNLNVALIEKKNDIVDDISFGNTSIIYDGSESVDDTTALLEKEGSQLIIQDCSKFNVKVKKIGSLRISKDNEDISKIEEMLKLSIKRNIDGVSLLKEDEISLKSIGAHNALYSENIYEINPYDLALAYGEVASDNGVIFRFQEEVINIEELTKGFKVTTTKNKFTCKIVINTILNKVNNRNNHFTKEGKNITYLLVNNTDKNIRNLIIKDLDNDEFVFCMPNFMGGSIMGIKSYNSLTIEEVLGYCKYIIPDMKSEDIITTYKEDKHSSMIIDFADIEQGYISVTGNHYSKITLAPAISKIIIETLSQKIKINNKKGFNDKRRDIYRFRDMNDKEKNELISVDKRYGNIVCLCNQITEGEIIDSIRRPLGARTLEGIKKRTGARIGNCFGSYCDRKIIKILSKEMDLKPNDINYDSKKSKVWACRIKEFDDV